VAQKIGAAQRANSTATWVANNENMKC
jgi:hypothetical protein